MIDNRLTCRDRDSLLSWQHHTLGTGWPRVLMIELEGIQSERPSVKEWSYPNVNALPHN